ncbi:MAG: hypothetical protein ACYDA2_06420 [Acidimicrobiales bacterium]
MSLSRLARLGGSVIAAVVVFVLVVPQTSLHRDDLGNLVLARTAEPGVPGLPSVAQSLKPSSSTVALTRAADRRDPDHTGLYAREWYVAPGAPPEVGIVVQVLPDAATAAAVERELRKGLDTEPILSGEKAQPATPVALPGVRGGAGAAFVLRDANGSSTATIGYAYKTVFAFDRVVVSELVVTVGTAEVSAPVVADARAETKLLERREPGFSFAHHHVPIVASVVFAVVALTAVAAVSFGPEAVLATVRRQRTRRHEREQRRARQQYLARGRRTVRRHKAPSWAQPRRR